jgi:predicted permease
MTLWQDVRYAGRMLLKSPGLTAIAALSLALGIGANTAIFSLVDEVVLKKLPVKNPTQLVRAGHTLPEGGADYSFPYSTYEQLRDRNHTLAGIFASDESRLSAMVDGQPEILQGAMVSGSYFRVLGVDAILGRTLTAEDDEPGQPPVTVISYAWWKRKFSLSPAVVSQTIVLKGMPFTIIGVTPPRFFGMSVSAPGPDIWVPMSMHEQLALKDHTEVAVRARLSPGISESQASADLGVIYQQVLTQAAGSSLTPEKQHTILTQGIKLLPVGRGGLRQFSQQLRILMAVVGLVLLIACANLANLLLGRSAARQKEIAVRLAIGASRWRLIRQLLTESVLLAMLGGALGLLFVWWGGDILLAVVSPNHAPIPPDVRILAFTAAVSLLTGVLFGLAPAFRASRVDLNPVLKENAGNVTSGGRRLQLGKSLVVAQMVLSLLLLIGAGLFLRTFQVSAKWISDTNANTFCWPGPFRR